MLFLNILFKCNRLCPYTRKNILFIIGILLGAFFGPAEQSQVIGCPVEVWPVIKQRSSLFTTKKDVTYF